MKKVLLENIKIIVAFILGIIVSGTTVYAVTALWDYQVNYDNSLSGLEATQVVDALHLLDMYRVDSDGLDLSTLETNNSKTILASSKGVCIFRNNKLNCFKINNYSFEKDHIQQVFSDGSCTVTTSYANCSDSIFDIMVDSSGMVTSYDNNVYEGCDVYDDGSVNCS